jgi:hypothetical protein
LSRRNPKPHPVGQASVRPEAPAPSKSWTAKHRVEAWACICDVAKRAAMEDPKGLRAWPTPWQRSCESEKFFREWLARAGLDAADLDREVERVRDLAEGRKVRQTLWRARRPRKAVDRLLAVGMSVRETSLLLPEKPKPTDLPGYDIAHVTRIRKAST